MENEIILRSLEEFNDFVNSTQGAVIYFSFPECNVCKVLKPKLKSYLKVNYPEMKFAYVDISVSKNLAAQNSIFTVPTVLFFFEGKEFLRKSRNINFIDLDAQLSRLYSLIFE